MQPMACRTVQSTMDVIAILMGWPSLTGALVLSSVGIWLRKPVLIWFGVVLITPMALYTSLSPAYPFVGIVPFVGLVTSALTCRWPRRWLSVTGVSLYGISLLLLAFIVINEPLH